MAISYNRLWKLLIDKGMTKTELRKAAGLTTNVIAKMGKQESVQLEALYKICHVWDAPWMTLQKLFRQQRKEMACGEIKF